MLAHRLRRQANIKPTLVQRVMFALSGQHTRSGEVTYNMLRQVEVDPGGNFPGS